MVSIENIVYDIYNEMLFANNNFDPFKKCQKFILVAFLKKEGKKEADIILPQLHI